MSTVLGERSLPGAVERRSRTLLVLAAGFLALYIPTYLGLARTLWREDDYAHGPIILAVFAWLMWRNRKPGTDHDSKTGDRPPFLLAAQADFRFGNGDLSPVFESVPGFLLLAIGLLLY